MDQRWKPVGSTYAPVAGRVGSTLGDRCVTGRSQKMQKETSSTNLKLKFIYYKVCDLKKYFFHFIGMR